MDPNNRDSLPTNYQVLHKFYQSIKKLSKTGELENEENTSAEAKKEMNDLIDRTIDTIDKAASEESARSLRLIAMKITMFYERSKILISLGDECLARETLKTALNMINDVVAEAEVIFLAFRIINHYAYLLTKQADFEAAREILEFGETIYESSRKKMEIVKFFTSDDLFVAEDFAVPATETSNKLERLVTNNLQMLSFVFNKLELHDKFAEYHHEVLRRQLEMNDEEVTMWAIKSARLASYFLSKNRFKEARHHLSAAIHVLHEYEKDLKAMENSNDKIDKLEDLKRKFAEVAKCWVKYGLFLFSVSKTSMVRQFCGEPNQVLERLWTIPFGGSVDNKNERSNFEETAFEIGAGTKSNTSFCDVHRGDANFTPVDQTRSTTSRGPTGTLPKLVEDEEQCESTNLTGINPDEYQGDVWRFKLTLSPIDPYLIFESLKNISEYENQVAASLVETTVQARTLFLHTHGWLKRVKVFYSLNEHPMEYVNAILDLSELYRYLAFYEEEIESQYAVQKLRADALETLSTVLREIRPRCYMAVSVELLRELAEVQLEMMGLNLRRIYAANEASSSTETSDVTFHKIDALSDMHSRLEQFRDNFGSSIEDIESRGCNHGTTVTENLTQLFM